MTSVEESKRIDADRGPKLVVSASGMLTGGRVLVEDRFGVEAVVPEIGDRVGV